MIQLIDHFFSYAVLKGVASLTRWYAVVRRIANARVQSIYPVVHILTVRIFNGVYTGRFAPAVKTVQFCQRCKFAVGQGERHTFLPCDGLVTDQHSLECIFPVPHSSICVARRAFFAVFVGKAAARLRASLLHAAEPCYALFAAVTFALHEVVEFMVWVSANDALDG